MGYILGTLIVLVLVAGGSLYGLAYVKAKAEKISVAAAIIALLSGK